MSIAAESCSKQGLASTHSLGAHAVAVPELGPATVWGWDSASSAVKPVLVNDFARTPLHSGPNGEAAEDRQATTLAKALDTGGSGNGGAAAAAVIGGNGSGNGGSGPAEAVATPQTPTRGGEDGSLASIVTAQRDRFRQRYVASDVESSPQALQPSIPSLMCRLAPDVAQLLSVQDQRCYHI